MRHKRSEELVATSPFQPHRVAHNWVANRRSIFGNAVLRDWRYFPTLSGNVDHRPADTMNTGKSANRIAGIRLSCLIFAVVQGRNDGMHFSSPFAPNWTSDGPCLLPAQAAIFSEPQSAGCTRRGLTDNPKLIFETYFRRMKIGVPSAGPNAMTSDMALVTAIRSGDQGAMKALYDRYSSIVYSVALRVLQDTGAAEDVLQDIFMQLWRNPGAFDASRGNMAAWLAVIARNRAIDALRRRRPEDDIEDVVVSVEHDLVSEADRSRTVDKVRGALQAMPAPRRS